MASVKVKSPATRGPGVQSANDQILNQRDLLDKAGKGFEKFIQDSRQQNERAAEINSRLHALGLEGMATREQFRDAVLGQNLTTEDGQKRFVELLALAKDFASLTPPIEEVPAPTPAIVDTPPTKEEDQAMSATTDKDYIEARLKAMSDSLDQRLETAAAKSDGRLEVIETRMDARIASLDVKLATGMAAMDAKFDANFARFESLLHKTTADIHKATTDTLSRVVAIVSGLVGVGIAVIVLVINNMAPKPASAQPPPAVIYAQPAATAPPPQAAAVPAVKP